MASVCGFMNVRDLQEASAIPFAALTAWRALKSTARIKEGYVSSAYVPMTGGSFLMCR